MNSAQHNMVGCVIVFWKAHLQMAEYLASIFGTEKDK